MRGGGSLQSKKFSEARGRGVVWNFFRQFIQFFWVQVPYHHHPLTTTTITTKCHQYPVVIITVCTETLRTWEVSLQKRILNIFVKKAEPSSCHNAHNFHHHNFGQNFLELAKLLGHHLHQYHHHHHFL